MVPQEYGVAAQDKVEIGVKIAYAMLSKLRRDPNPNPDPDPNPNPNPDPNPSLRMTPRAAVS